jgi:hypothetical protein
VRYFPDKLPIGVLPGLDHHAFVYLVTSRSPMDFRLFLLRHVRLFRVLFRWTIRLLLPRPLWKARLVYEHAAREHLGERLEPANAQVLEWLFLERKRLAEPGATPADERYLRTAKNLGEMLALRFKDVDLARGLITLRGERPRADALVSCRLRLRGCVRSSNGCSSMLMVRRSQPMPLCSATRPANRLAASERRGLRLC